MLCLPVSGARAGFIEDLHAQRLRSAGAGGEVEVHTLPPVQFGHTMRKHGFAHIAVFAVRVGDKTKATVRVIPFHFANRNIFQTFLLIQNFLKELHAISSHLNGNNQRGGWPNGDHSRFLGIPR